MTILILLRKHSPDGTSQTRRHTSDISYYSNYRPRKDERLSWPSWLTYSGRLTHISGHPSAAGRAWDRESSPVKDQRFTTLQRSQPKVQKLLSGHARQTDSCNLPTPTTKTNNQYRIRENL